MKMPQVLVGLAAAGLLAGCAGQFNGDSRTPSDPQLNALDASSVRAIQDTAINNAIVNQHTLFPYHFVTGGATLNDLGKRDLGVLLAHCQSLAPTPPNAFAVSVRRGNADNGLYDARVAAVKSALKDGGLEDGRLQITDGLPGGPGITSDRAVQILAKEADAKPFLENSPGTSGSNTSGSTGSTGSGASGSMK